MNEMFNCIFDLIKEVYLRVGWIYRERINVILKRVM